MTEFLESTALHNYFFKIERTKYLLHIYNNQSEVLWTAKVSRDLGNNVQTLKRYNNKFKDKGLLKETEKTKVEKDMGKNKSVRPLELTEKGKSVAQSLDLVWKKVLSKQQSEEA